MECNGILESSNKVHQKLYFVCKVTSIEVCIDVPGMNARSAKLNLGRICCQTRITR